MPVIGYLDSDSPGPTAPSVAAFRQGLSETGYVEGQNVAIEYRWAEGHYDRLPALAADLVGRKVDVIAAWRHRCGTSGEKCDLDDPDRLYRSSPTRSEPGLVASLARPGGNLTGVSLLAVELTPKRLELISELVPQARVIALLVNPNNPVAEPMMRDVQEAARAKGLQLHILKAGTESEIDDLFRIPRRAARRRARCRRRRVLQQPARADRERWQRAMPFRRSMIWREFAAAGGLISYGASFTGAYRHAGTYAGRIFKGAKPADLPVQQPTTFELVINLNTAKALGLTVPPSILARADEVIE